MKKLLFVIPILFLFLEGMTIPDSYVNIQKEKRYAILFVGNSLTYTNNLPLLVKRAAKKRGIKIKTEVLAFSDYGLKNHLSNKNLSEIITKGKFDFVIIQQGPSSLQEGKESLIKYGKEINMLCKKTNALLVYFMVWPPMSRYHTFDAVINHYRVAAEMNNAILCPVGEVWKSHFDDTKDFNYYGPDAFHPSLKGSQEAAKVIVNTLFVK